METPTFQTRHIAKAAIGRKPVNGCLVYRPTFQPAKMLRDVRVAALAGRTAASCGGRERQQRAVPVQAGKVCNHRASPNRHLSSIPRNGYGAANMQCAGRATAHREPLVDGEIRRPINAGFREAAARHAMAAQSPERAVRFRQVDARLAVSAATPRSATGRKQQ